MSEKQRGRPKSEYDPELVRDISVEVYKKRLGQRDTERMLAKDGDGGQKLRERAGSYDALTKCYLDALIPTRLGFFVSQ